MFNLDILTSAFVCVFFFMAVICSSYSGALEIVRGQVVFLSREGALTPPVF